MSGRETARCGGWQPGEKRSSVTTENTPQSPGECLWRGIAFGGSYGFITPEQLQLIAEDPVTMHRKVLIRFHEGRVLCPASAARAEIVHREDDPDSPWYCRDVSIPSTDSVWEETCLSLPASLQPCARGCPVCSTDRGSR